MKEKQIEGTKTVQPSKEQTPKANHPNKNPDNK